MLTDESTENLLDNLDNELTDLIEMENNQKFIEIVETKADIETEKRPKLPRSRKKINQEAT
jgi:hypothetical protein